MSLSLGRRLILVALFTGFFSPDVIGQELIEVFKGHTDKVTCVAVSPDDRFALSSSDDKTIRLWDLEGRKEVKTFADHQNYVLALAFGAKGDFFVSAGGGQWRGPNFATETDQLVRLWDLRNSKVVARLSGHTAPVWSVALIKNGKGVLSASGGYEFRGGKPFPSGHAIKQWDLEKHEEVRAFSGHTDWVRCVAPSPDETRFASASWDKSVRVWDLKSGRAIRRLDGHQDMINAVAYSTDGKFLLSGGGRPQLPAGDTSLRLWDAESGKQLRRFEGHSGRVWSVAFSPNGKTALSSAADGTVRLWEIASGREVLRLVGHNEDVRKAVFLSGGREILSAGHDKTVRLWRVPQSR